MATPWYSKYLSVYEQPFKDVPTAVLTEIRQKLHNIQSNNPVVTVSVIGYNEEKHLTACLWSLSEQLCKYPLEIIGVDNDSTDHTAEIFHTLEVPYHTETRHSCGYARLCGLTHAKGKYHINIDADTMYPPHYVETVVDKLEKKDVVGVSSTWNYLPTENNSRLSLKLYTLARDLFLWFQSFKSPELSVRGLVFAYRTDLAKKIGIRTDIIRGEDGTLAFGLKQHGRIIFLHTSRACAITSYNTIGADGTLFQSFNVRMINSLKRIGHIFHSTTYYKDEDSNLIKPK